jgi:CBS domain-containing protein
MRIGEICTREVVYCGRGDSVQHVAQLMRNCHVGDLVVAEWHDGRLVPVGVVTDRELVVKVLARGAEPATLTAGDLMTRRVVTAAESEPVHAAIERMRAEGVRRLPVVDADGGLVGVLSADDIGELLAEELAGLARIAPRQATLEKAALVPVQQ